jgi:hypothetical protein
MAILKLEASVLTLRKGRRLAMFIATWTLMLRAQEEVPTEETLMDRYSRKSVTLHNLACNFFTCKFKDVHDVKDVKVCRIAFVEG